MASDEVVVVGAGVVGLSVAFRLAQRGMRVTVLERAQPGSGTTSPSFGWVNASSKRRQPYFALNYAGLHAWERLNAETGARYFRQCGNVEWCSDPAAGEALLDRARVMQERGYPVEILPEVSLRTGLPEANIRATSAVCFPAEGYVEPEPFVRGMLEWLRKLDVRVRAHTAVTGIAGGGNTTAIVTLDSEEQISCDAAVLSCGRWTPHLAAALGTEIPLVAPTVPASPAVGLVAWTEPVDSDVRHVIHSPRLNLRPASRSRLQLHSEEVDAMVAHDEPVDGGHPAARELLRRAVDLLPALAGASLESAQICIRPLPVDGESIVGWLPGAEGVYVAVTHSGITLGPLLGELIAAEIAGEEQQLLHEFRPSRFQGSG